MKNIPASTIMLLSIVLFLISLLFLKTSISEMKNAQEYHQEFLNSSHEYNSLKKSWGNSASDQKELESIIKQLKIKDITKSVKSKKISISFKNTTPALTQKFLNKVLNSNLKIETLKLTKENVELEVGI